MLSQHLLSLHYDTFPLCKPAALCCVRPAEGHYHLYLHMNLPLVKVFLIAGDNKLYLGSSVKSRCIWVLLAGSAVESVRGWSSQWPFRQQPPVTSSALTWHVKTLLKASWHPPALAHLSFHAHDTPNTHLFARISYHTIKHKAFPTSCQPYACSPMPLRHQLSRLLLSPPFFTQSHANTLSGSISLDWIDGPQAFRWLRRCQIWWVIGKLCLAVTLSGMVIHFVNPDL